MMSTETKEQRAKRLNREAVARFRAKKRLAKASKTFKEDKPEIKTEDSFNPLEPFVPEPKSTTNKQNPQEFCPNCHRHRFYCECEPRVDD